MLPCKPLAAEGGRLLAVINTAHEGTMKSSWITWRPAW